MRKLLSPARMIQVGMSLRVAVIGFIALMCLVPAIVDGFRVWQERDLAIAESTRNTSNLARAIGQHAEDTFRLADGFLSGLVERTEHGGTVPAERERLRDFLVARLSTLQGVRLLAVTDATGNVIVGSAPTAQGLNLADTEAFGFHRDHPDRATHYGHPARNLVTREWLIPLTRRIDNPDGSFAGIAVAALDMGYFEQFYRTFDIGEHGSIFLALRDGTLLARRPHDDAVIGTDLNKGVVFHSLDSIGPVGNVETRAPTDSLVRFNAYRQLTDYPLVVSVALEKDEVLAPWRARLWSDLESDLGLGAAIAFFGVLLLLQMGQRARAQRATEAAKRELEIAYRRLEAIAQEDALTHLANRRCFDATLEKELSRAARTGATLSLIMIDIDYFKRFNDRYGHPAGDACLRTIAGVVKNVVGRSADLVARYGGEEFVVLLPDTAEAGAETVARRILYAVRALQIAHTDSPKTTVTISLGVASASGTQAVAPGQLVEAADERLYAAKAAGRDTLVADDAWMPNAAQLRAV